MKGGSARNEILEIDQSIAALVNPLVSPAQHAGTIRVLHTLRPFAVAMAGEAEFDPFKD